MRASTYLINEVAMNFPRIDRMDVSPVNALQVSPQIIKNKRLQLNAQDTLFMQINSSPSIATIWNRFVSCLQKIWEGILGCFGIKRSPAIFTLHPSAYPHQITNPNKIFAYNHLVQGGSVGDHVIARKFSLNDSDALKSATLFTKTSPLLKVIQGGFCYDTSTQDTIHWTANFADRHLFGFCEGPLLAQDELQVLEHPALAHIKGALPSHARQLDGYDAALFQNILRLGALDTTTPLSNGNTLYGNNFAKATQEQILSRLKRFDIPTQSNIFAIAAPHIPSSLKNQPYQKKDLETLFFTAYNAFHNILEVSSGKKTVIHTGNWGAGAFGNDPKTVYLLQLAAARLAGVDEVRMHPMGNQRELNEATQLLDALEKQFPQMTIGQFIDHLTANAATYGLKYKEGNGT